MFASQGIKYALTADCLTLEGSLHSGVIEIDPSQSSQYVTGLLFTLPLLDGDSQIRFTGKLQSKPYVDITLDVLNQAGIVAEYTAKGISVKGGQKFDLSDSHVEGDWSNAAFLDFYKHFGRLIAEAVWFGGCRNPERLHRQRIVEYSNIDDFDKVYAESKGIVALYSHLGNWELMGGCASYDYREGGHLPDGLDPNDVVFVYKPLKSRMWDEIMRKNRCAPVLRIGYDSYVSSEDFLRYAVRNRGRKLVVNVNTDQSPYKNSTVDDTVDFMNQKTKTMLGAASIACKFGWSVLYSSMVPAGKGHYEWRFTEITKDASTMTPHDIMQEYYRLLQADIEAYPWCYLWSHKRWKR